MTQKIFLVRHGRSAHVHSGAIDFDGFHRWREAYETAGIVEREDAPAEVKALAGVVVASPAPRAMQSAALLGREVTTSPLLRELELVPPNIRGVRLPMVVWLLAYTARWLKRAVLRRPHESAAELQRAREAAEWLTALAAQHGSVVAVTHASFRSLLARQLIASGWRCAIPRGRTRHWSVWTVTR